MWRSRALLVLLVLFAVVRSAAAGAAPAAIAPSDEMDFTASFARKVEAAIGDKTGVRVDGPLALTVKGGAAWRELRVYLDRVWDRCARDPAGCEAAVAGFAEQIAAMRNEAEGPLEAGALRVVVRTADYLAAARREGEGDPRNEIVAVPLAGDLWTVCVVDGATSATLLTVDDLGRLGVSRNEAVASCARNLAAALRPLGEASRPSPDGTFSYLADDGYYASGRLALREQWAEAARAMRGPLVAAAPESGVLIFGDAGLPGVVENMRAFAEAVARDAERPISPVLLEWTPAGWRPLDG